MPAFHNFEQPQILMVPDNSSQKKVNSLTGQILDKNVPKDLRNYKNDETSKLLA